MKKNSNHISVIFLLAFDSNTSQAVGFKVRKGGVIMLHKTC